MVCHVFATAPVFESLASEYEGRAMLVKVDADQARPLVTSLGVKGFPTFIVFVNGERKVRQHTRLDSFLKGFILT